MTWFHCVRCRQDGTIAAIKKARAAGEKNEVVRRIHGEAHAVCGWMQRSCRHKAQCIEGEPPDVVLNLMAIQAGLRPTPDKAAARVHESIRDMCARMEAIAREPAHVEAAEKADVLADERERREIATSQRLKAANEQERRQKRAEYVARKRRRALDDGLVEIRCTGGPPLDKMDFDIDMAPFLPGITWDMAKECRQNELRYIVEIVRENRSIKVTPQFFYDMVRRHRAGLVRVFVSKEHAREVPDQVVNKPQKDGEDSFVAYDGDYNDLPVDMYDGGESRQWKKKQRDAEKAWRSKQPARQTKTDNMLSELLGGIGRKRE